VGSTTKVELTTAIADCQSFLHRLLTSIVCKSLHSGLRDSRRSEGGWKTPSYTMVARSRKNWTTSSTTQSCHRQVDNAGWMSPCLAIIWWSPSPVIYLVSSHGQRCGPRPSVLGQDRSRNIKKICLGFGLGLARWGLGLSLGLAGLALCCETPYARRYNDLEGYSNFSTTIYSFYTLCLEHHYYCGDQQWRLLT